MHHLHSIPIYVIEAKEKRTSTIGEQLVDLGVSYSSVPATFLDTFPSRFDPINSQIKLRRKLSLPEIGCAESHMNCYRKILESEDEIALIFEDDAYITDIKSLNVALSYLDEMILESKICISLYSKFATLRNGYFVHRNFHSVVDIPSSTVGYLVTRTAAESLLNSNKNHTYNADWPKNSNVQFYLTKNRFLETGFNDSLMENNRGTVNISTLERYLIMLSVFSFHYYFKHQNAFSSFSEYVNIMIKPTLVRTLYRIFSFPIFSLGKGVRMSLFY